MINLSPPKLRWGELIGSALILAFLIYDQSTKRDLLAGWNRLWLLAGLVAAGLIALCAFRKWRDN